MLCLKGNIYIILQLSCFPMKITNTICLITTSHEMVNGSVLTVSQAVIFEVSTRLLLTIEVFWEAKVRCWESGSQHSEQLNCFHFQVPTVQEEWTP